MESMESTKVDSKPSKVDSTVGAPVSSTSTMDDKKLNIEEGVELKAPPRKTSRPASQASELIGASTGSAAGAGPESMSEEQIEVVLAAAEDESDMQVSGHFK